MSNEGSDYEARILELEREAVRLHKRLIPMETGRIRAVEEGLAMVQGARPCITTIKGTIYDGRLNPFPGATIRFVGHVTSNDYGTATADGSGNFEHAIEASSADGTLAVSLDLYTDHPTDGGRLDGAVLIDTEGFSPCVVSSTVDIRASGQRGVEADTGYVYPVSGISQTAPSAFPIATSMNADDSGNAGTFTATWTGSAWVGTHGGSTYTFDWDENHDRFEVNITPGFLVVNFGTTWTDPDPATSTKFSVTMTFVGIPGRTITFQEP